jgi:uncharacterized YkwD family protein
MNKQHNKGLKKTLLLGTLALAISIPVGVGAASAASYNGSTGNSTAITTFATQYGIDLNALLQQYMQGSFPVVSQPVVTGHKHVVTGHKHVVHKKHKPSQPSQGSSNAGTGTAGTGTAGTGTTGNTGSGTSTGTVAPASAFATQVVTLVNQERAKAGLSPLKANNATLTKMALDKAKDMYSKGYFDHNSPTYGSPFDMMKKYGINFGYAGENIAKGQPTPQVVMTDWMNSAGHRANILNANYTTIGVAYYNGEWVQEFIS